jgi:hypothetical protein
VAELADWVFSAGWLRSAVALAVLCLATAADEGLGWSLVLCTVACERATFAARVVELGSAEVD